MKRGPSWPNQIIKKSMHRPCPEPKHGETTMGLTKRLTKTLLGAGLAVALGFALAAPVAAQTADGETPAVEDICSLWGFTGQLKGLCDAYCEAMDCDDVSPQASDRACERVLTKIESLLPGATEFPICEDTDDDGVPNGIDNCPAAANPDQADEDGNGIGDACEVVDKVVFVTSNKYTANLGGLVGADATCNALAAGAGLPGEYKAWLATDDDSDPESTFVRSSRPYVRPDGVVVAANWDDLVDGTLSAPINVDETEVAHVNGDGVWTNVLPTGAAKGNTDEDHCVSWSDASFAHTANLGLWTATDSFWTDWSDPNVHLFCGEQSARFYCFEQ